MFIFGGEIVYPCAVVNAHFQMPQVAGAAVLAVPDARCARAGLAVVVARPRTPAGRLERTNPQARSCGGHG